MLWQTAQHSFVAWSVGFLMGTVLAKGLGGRIRRAWRAHLAQQAQIVDALDTSTPGGITDVVDAVRQSQANGGA